MSLMLMNLVHKEILIKQVHQPTGSVTLSTHFECMQMARDRSEEFVRAQSGRSCATSMRVNRGGHPSVLQ